MAIGVFAHSRPVRRALVFHRYTSGTADWHPSLELRHGHFLEVSSLSYVGASPYSPCRP